MKFFSKKHLVGILISILVIWCGNDVFGRGVENIAWLLHRFGYSTEIYETKVTVDSFTTEEYDQLIATINKKGKFLYPQRVAFALLPLYRLLKENPTHEKYSKYTQQLYSIDFLKKVLYHAPPISRMNLEMTKNLLYKTSNMIILIKFFLI